LYKVRSRYSNVRAKLIIFLLDVLRRNASFLFYLQMQENLGDLFGKHIY
jgi:hypothetical protein